MKRISVIVVILATSLLSSAFAVEIPKQFIGTWGEAQACKANKETGMGVEAPGATIEAKRVSWIELGCNLVSLTKSTDTQLTGALKCESENGTSKMKLVLERKGDKLSINGGKPVPLCSK